MKALAQVKTNAKRIVVASVKGWLQDWTGKNEIEVELSGSERVQQLAVAGVTVPFSPYLTITFLIANNYDSNRNS